MQLSFSEEQIMLRDTATRFLRERYGFETRRTIARSEKAMSRDLWREFAELGWLGLPFHGDDGGLGGDAIDVHVLMEAFGGALVLEPYLSCVVICGKLIESLGNTAQRREWLGAIAAGREVFAFANDEDDRFGKMETVAVPAQGGWRLSGTKRMVFGGAAADNFIVSARLPREDDAVALFVVARDRGVDLAVYPAFDGGKVCNLELADVSVPSTARLTGTDVQEAIDLAIGCAVAATSSEGVGAMRALLSSTIDYTRTRAQFGRQLSANQVLRHRMADMAVRIEEASAMSLRAALHLRAEAPVRSRAISATKAKVAVAARFVAEQAVQLHGGMGVTDELSVGTYFKRLLAIEIMFGSSAEHLLKHARSMRPGA